MPRSILLSEFFLPPAVVGLRRFAISFDEPHHDFNDPLCTAGLDVTEKVQTQFDSNHHSAHHLYGGSQLTGFPAFSFSNRLKSSTRVTVDESKTHYLNNAGQWFRDAVKSEETRKWMSEPSTKGVIYTSSLPIT
jgi:hypothetical protein